MVTQSIFYYYFPTIQRITQTAATHLNQDL